MSGFLVTPLAANGTEIWLGGVDPVVRAVSDPHAASDYLDMFQPTAPWQNAAQVVRVFKTSTQFLDSASDEVLSRMFADLKRRNISLGMAALILTPSEKCGRGIEGYGPQQAMGRIAARVKRLGGDLRFVAMDEPLDFGHYSVLPNACHSSLPELAADIAGKVRAIRLIFPQVQIGDTEGLGYPGPPDVQAIMDWTKAYQSAVGTPLSFVQLDVAWTAPWKQQIKELAGRLHAAGIKFGIIYDGDPDDQSGLAWTRDAERRFVMVEADPALVPDQAILQTWMDHPSHMLPETKAGTMTWLVNRYIAEPTRLTLYRTGDRVAGQLVDSAGHPIPGVPVTVSAEYQGTAGAPGLHTRSGRVPPNAAGALFAVRINSECGCRGAADIAIGPMRYHDNRTGQTVQQVIRPALPAEGIAALIKIQAQPGQPVMRNTERFPVTAGNPFTIQVPMITNQTSADSGYIALIFQNTNDKGIERFKLSLAPAQMPVGTVTTDGRGEFSLLPNPDVLRASSGFAADFAGDAHHRLSSAAIH